MEKPKNYGLQLRVKPNQKKQATRPPLPNPLKFNDNDDDDDNVERDILRQAHKNKSHRDIEEQHKKALEEDPSAFDYDGVYDDMKQKQVRPVQIERKDRQPRYIGAIMEKVKLREREQEIIYERKLAKERSQDEHLFADKDKFVTGAYKRKLAEQEKWKEEERLREMREEKDDVTKKTDLSDFYFNLAKNTAFGAEKAGLRKPVEKHEEHVKSQEVSPPESNESSRSPRKSPESSAMANEHHEEIAPVEIPSQKEKTDAKTILETSTQNEVPNEPPAVVPDHHKRTEDSVAAARERYLARKKAKVQ